MLSMSNPAAPRSSGDETTQIKEVSAPGEQLVGALVEQQKAEEKKQETPPEPAKPQKAVPPKSMTAEELRIFVTGCVEDVVKGHDTFDNAEVLDRLKGISKTYFDYKQERKIIGNHLCNCSFPAQLLKMLKWYNGAGIFKNDDIWFPTYYSYNIVWNYTDCSRDLAMEFAEVGIIQLCTVNIKHAPYLENAESKNVTYILKASLSILQNLCKFTELKDLFEEEGVKDALKPFLSHENEFFRALATMVLTALISEEENSRLEDTGGMEFMISGLKSALKNTKSRRYRGFSTDELVMCLGRMAVNDSNKKIMVERGILPLLTQMMQGDVDEEHLAACQTLWNLSFDKEVAAKLKAEPGLCEALDKLSQSNNARVKKMAKGAVWMLNETERKVERKPSAETGTGGHIFISYSWSHQEEVVQIKDALKTAGYKVWIDVEMMGGSTLEAMADGVDNASVMMVCASENYKMSPNARAEAEYAFQLKKPVVPVMMQRKYKPDGWLGMIMGAKLYVNFDGKYPFEKAFGMLEKELAGRGKGGDRGRGVDQVDAPALPKTFAAPPSQASPKKAKQLPATASWDHQKVTDWLREHGLQSKLDHFAGYDGKLFWNLLSIRQEVPEFFYKYVHEKMHLDMLDISRLVTALDELPN